MKKRVIMISILAVVLTLSVLLIAGVFDTTYDLYDVTQEEAIEAYDLLNGSLDETKSRNTYFDYINNASVRYGNNSYDAIMIDGMDTEEYKYDGNDVTVLSYTNTVQYEVDVDTAGYYELALDCYILDNPLTNYNLSVLVNDKSLFDEADVIDVPIYWEDSTKEFPLDSYKDEAQPQSNRIDRWFTLDLYDNKYSTDTPLLFKFDEGVNVISITLLTGNGRLVVGDLKLNQPKQIKSYSSYIEAYPNVEIDEKSYPINSISYIEKNSSYIRMSSLNKSLAQPYSAKQKKLNIIDGGSWNKAGQEITYEVEILETGLYSLDLYYRNNKDEYSVFRTILIDGEVPFAECLSYEFKCTGTSYKVHTLGNEDGDFKFYLGKGTHRITLKNEVAPLYSALTKLQLVIDHINQLSLEVLKITGSDIDEDRTWDITKYIPETESYLLAYDTLLKNIVNELSVYSDNGPNSATIGYVQRCIKLLVDVMKHPEELPLYLETLYSGTSSINQLLGDVITNLNKQPMYLESFHLNSDGAKSSVKKNNVFKNFGNSVVSLWQTFFSDKYDPQTNKDNTLVVWVNRPITYIDTMQRLIDSEYNTSHDVKVKLSAMPDQSKLTLSVAANNAPDVVLGLSSYIPYDLAIRGGVYDLTTFPDFNEVAGRFTEGSLLSFVVSDESGDKIYAIPETLDFNVVVYREDIFNALDINTNLNSWDDLIAILPTLQRYGMNFYMPVAADNSTKWFYQTSALLLQAGGSLYKEDGLSVNINSPESIEGLELLTTLFTEKSLPTNVPSFYSQFRNGTLPIGVCNFSTYLQLKNAAPEIAGKWKIITPLGTQRENEDGSTYIDRTYITSGTSAAIMSTTKYADDSWEFLKWWTSTDIQSRFGYNLQSTYGPEYLWLSSNIDAILNSQFEQADKEVILSSVDWIVDVVRNPGQYMVERGLSNIWTSTVLSGEPLRVAIQNEVILMNREITKKMKEFGYLNSNGEVAVVFHTRDLSWIKDKIGKGDNDNE